MKSPISILLIISILILILFSLRLFLPVQIDDVSPEIFCENNYLEKSDILWVIPKFNNKSISDNKTWCAEIKSLNKTLGLHGITNTYEEFNYPISQIQLDEAIKIFEQCFNETPTLFKPSHLKISKENKQLIKQNNLILKVRLNQLFHKLSPPWPENRQILSFELLSNRHPFLARHLPFFYLNP